MSQESLVKFWLFPESKMACICPPLFSAISLRSHFLKSKNISLYHHIKVFKKKKNISSSVIASIQVGLQWSVYSGVNIYERKAPPILDETDLHNQKMYRNDGAGLSRPGHKRHSDFHPCTFWLLWGKSADTPWGHLSNPAERYREELRPPTNSGEAWRLPASSSVTAPSLKQILWSQQSCRGMAVLSSILTATSWETAEPEINKRFLTHRDFEETNLYCLELLVVRWFVM